MQRRNLNGFKCINAALEAEDELGWHMNEMVVIHTAQNPAFRQKTRDQSLEGL